MMILGIDTRRESGWSSRALRGLIITMVVGVLFVAATLIAWIMLNVIAIEIPPLRDRVEDIVPLSRHFLALGHTDIKRLSRAAVKALTRHQWPGNVRELANAMERASLLCQTDVILPEHLPAAVCESAARAAVESSEGQAPFRPDVKTLEESEIETIRQALDQTGGNRTRATELLGITRRGLIYKLKRLGLE